MVSMLAGHNLHDLGGAPFDWAAVVGSWVFYVLFYHLISRIRVLTKSDRKRQVYGRDTKQG